MAASVSIASEDVVRLMLQFLKESNLTRTLECLQSEAEVGLNTVESTEVFLGDVQAGRWESVLPQVSSMRLPNDKVVPLYEQVLFELLEAGERELCREFLRATPCLLGLKTSDPQRHARLEHLCSRATFSALDCYEFQQTKETRRADLASSLASEVSVAPPSRLLALLGQAVKYQQLQGGGGAGGAGAAGGGGAGFDLFRGSRRASRRDVDEKVIRRLCGQIKFPPGSHAETALFSPDGISLVTGSVDGFVEVWDYESCKLRKDLEYQARDALMAHDEEQRAVLCSAFSRDAEHLATGSQGGTIRLWKVSTGQCVKRFVQAHPQGVTAVCFSRDATQLLSASFDGSVRLHGIKSGKALKEFRGHTSYVNACCFSRDGQTVASGSSDGTVKLWDLRTCDCLLTVRPGLASFGAAGAAGGAVGAGGGGGGMGHDTTVLAVVPVPHSDNFFVLGKASTAHLLGPQGDTLRAYSSGKRGDRCDFLCCCVSPQGRWAYCLCEDGSMSVFDVMRGTLEETVVVSERECIAMAHHPHRNLLVTLADDGQLRLWKA